MSSIFRLTAPRKLGQIPEGFVLTVHTDCNYCDQDDVAEALKRAGFTDYDSLSYKSSGNWLCEQIK